MSKSLWFLIAALMLGSCGGDPEPAEEPIVFDVAGGEAPADDPAEDPRGEEPPLVIGDDTCETDADCVPDQCCHPAACVAVANAPSCQDAACTADCRFGTLDCGGACLCHEGRCAARLSEAPDLTVQ